MAMNDKTRRRTSRVVAGEIEALEQARDRAIAAAHETATTAERQARIDATQAVGKIKKEYTDPAMREVGIVRERSRAKAKEIHDKAVAAAHGEYQKTLLEIDAAHEAAKSSIDQTASAQIRPHEETLRAAQAEAGKKYGYAVTSAKAACEIAVEPLRREHAALKTAEDKKVVTTEMPLGRETLVEKFSEVEPRRRRRRR